MLSDIANEKVLKYSLKTSKITSKILFKLINYILSDQVKNGEQSFKDLYRKGKELDNIPVDSKDLRQLKRELKKNHVDFAIKKSENGVYDIYFKGQDVKHIKGVLEKYMSKKMNQETSIKTRMQKANNKAKVHNAEHSQDNQKNKQKQRGRDSR